MQNTSNTQSHWNLIQDGTQQYLLRKISNTPLSNIEHFVQRLQLCKHKSIAIPELVRLADGDIYFKEKRGPKTLEQFVQTQPSTQAKLFLLHQLSRALDNLHTFVGMPHGNLTIQCISITESGDMLLGGLECNKNKQEVDTADLHKIISILLHLPEEQVLIQRLQGLQPFRVRSELQNLLADDNWEVIVSSWKNAVHQTSNEESSEDIEDVEMFDVSLDLLQQESALFDTHEESPTPISLEKNYTPKFSENKEDSDLEESAVSTTEETVAITFDDDDFGFILEEELPTPAQITLEKTPLPTAENSKEFSVDVTEAVSATPSLPELEFDDMDDATEAIPSTSAVQLKKQRNTDIFANLFSTTNDFSNDFSIEGTEDIESIEDASADVYSIDDIPEYQSMGEIHPPTSPTPILQKEDIRDQYLDTWMQTPAPAKYPQKTAPTFFEKHGFWMITGLGVVATTWGIYLQNNKPSSITRETVSQSKEKLNKVLQQTPVPQLEKRQSLPQEEPPTASVETTVVDAEVPITTPDATTPVESTTNSVVAVVSVPKEASTNTKEEPPSVVASQKIENIPTVSRVEEKTSPTKKQQPKPTTQKLESKKDPGVSADSSAKKEQKKTEKPNTLSVQTQKKNQEQTVYKEQKENKENTSVKTVSTPKTTSNTNKSQNTTNKPNKATTTVVVPTNSTTVVSTNTDVSNLQDNYLTQSNSLQNNLDLRGADNQTMLISDSVENVFEAQPSTSSPAQTDTLPSSESIVAMATQTERETPKEKQQEPSGEKKTVTPDITEDIPVEKTQSLDTTAQPSSKSSKTKDIVSPTNWDDVSTLAINGHIDTRTLEQIRSIEKTDPNFTRVNSIALTYGQQSNDIAVIQESLTKILSLEQNQNQPIYLLAMAQHQFNSKNFEQTREYLLQAEKNWGNVDRDHLASLRLQRDNIVAHMSYVTYMQNGKEDSRIQSLMQFRKVQRNAQKTVKDSVFKVAQEKIVILQQFAPGNTSDNGEPQ